MSRQTTIYRGWAIALCLAGFALLIWYSESKFPSPEFGVRASASGFSRDSGASVADDDLTVDLVIVFTAWKRATLAEYFSYLERQDIFINRGPRFRVHVIVFQNGRHLDVSGIVAEWGAPRKWGVRDVLVTHVHSALATGYFGRFLAPLLSNVRKDSYWLVADDDVIWGAHYITNMLRVVDEGRLAVRVGRFVYSDGPQWQEHAGSTYRGVRGVFVTFEEDLLYDFGGQLWAGRIDWLQKAWAHPPATLVTAEDFWISAVLSSFYGISTARPRCPASDVEACACSMKVAGIHVEIELGNQTGGEEARNAAITVHAVATEYRPLGDNALAHERAAYSFSSAGERNWNLSDTAFSECLSFM